MRKQFCEEYNKAIIYLNVGDNCCLVHIILLTHVNFTMRGTTNELTTYSSRKWCHFAFSHTSNRCSRCTAIFCCWSSVQADKLVRETVPESSTMSVKQRTFNKSLSRARLVRNWASIRVAKKEMEVFTGQARWISGKSALDNYHLLHTPEYLLRGYRYYRSWYN